MIAKFFNKTKPINTLIILVFVVIIFGITSFFLFDFEFSLEFFIKKMILLSLLLATFFVTNFIIRKNRLVKGNSYVLLLFALFIGMFPFSLSDINLLAIHFLLLLAYRRIYSLRTVKDTNKKIFDSSLWIGTAALFYPFSILYLLVVYAAIYLFNKMTLRNIIIPFVGIATPALIYMAYLFLIDDFANYELHLNYSLSFLNYNSFKLLLPLAIITGLLIWSIFPATIKIIRVNNEFRTSWFLLLIHILISSLFVMISPVKNGSEFLFLFFPLSIIFTNYLQVVEEKWFKEVFLYLFLVITIVVYFL